MPKETSELPWLARCIRELRAFRGLKQWELGERLHVSRTWLNKLENSRCRPVLASLVRLADGLQVPIDALVEEDDLVAWAAVLVAVCGQRERAAVLVRAEAMTATRGSPPNKRRVAAPLEAHTG